MALVNPNMKLVVQVLNRELPNVPNANGLFQIDVGEYVEEIIAYRQRKNAELPYNSFCRPPKNSNVWEDTSRPCSRANDNPVNSGAAGMGSIRMGRTATSSTPIVGAATGRVNSKNKNTVGKMNQSETFEPGVTMVRGPCGVNTIGKKIRSEQHNLHACRPSSSSSIEMVAGANAVLYNQEQGQNATSRKGSNTSQSRSPKPPPPPMRPKGTRPAPLGTNAKGDPMTSFELAEEIEYAHGNPQNFLQSLTVEEAKYIISLELGYKVYNCGQIPTHLMDLIKVDDGIARRASEFRGRQQLIKYDAKNTRTRARMQGIINNGDHAQFQDYSQLKETATKIGQTEADSLRYLYSNLKAQEIGKGKKHDLEEQVDGFQNLKTRKPIEGTRARIAELIEFGRNLLRIDGARALELAQGRSAEAEDAQRWWREDDWYTVLEEDENHSICSNKKSFSAGSFCEPKEGNHRQVQHDSFLANARVLGRDTFPADSVLVEDSDTFRGADEDDCDHRQWQESANVTARDEGLSQNNRPEPIFSDRDEQDRTYKDALMGSVYTTNTSMSNTPKAKGTGASAALVAAATGAGAPDASGFVVASAGAGAAGAANPLVSAEGSNAPVTGTPSARGKKKKKKAPVGLAAENLDALNERWREAKRYERKNRKMEKYVPTNGVAITRPRSHKYFSQIVDQVEVSIDDNQLTILQGLSPTGEVPFSGPIVNKPTNSQEAEDMWDLPANYDETVQHLKMLNRPLTPTETVQSVLHSVFTKNRRGEIAGWKAWRFDISTEARARFSLKLLEFLDLAEVLEQDDRLLLGSTKFGQEDVMDVVDVEYFDDGQSTDSQQQGGILAAGGLSLSGSFSEGKKKLKTASAKKLAMADTADTVSYRELSAYQGPQPKMGGKFRQYSNDQIGQNSNSTPMQMGVKPCGNIIPMAMPVHDEGRHRQLIDSLSEGQHKQSQSGFCPPVFSQPNLRRIEEDERAALAMKNERVMEFFDYSSSSGGPSDPSNSPGSMRKTKKNKLQTKSKRVPYFQIIVVFSQSSFHHKEHLPYEFLSRAQNLRTAREMLHCMDTQSLNLVDWKGHSLMNRAIDKAFFDQPRQHLLLQALIEQAPRFQHLRWCGNRKNILFFAVEKFWHELIVRIILLAVINYQFKKLMVAIESSEENDLPTAIKKKIWKSIEDDVYGIPLRDLRHQTFDDPYTVGECPSIYELFGNPERGFSMRFPPISPLVSIHERDRHGRSILFDIIDSNHGDMLALFLKFTLENPQWDSEEGTFPLLEMTTGTANSNILMYAVLKRKEGIVLKVLTELCLIIKKLSVEDEVGSLKSAKGHSATSSSKKSYWSADTSDRDWINHNRNDRYSPETDVTEEESTEGLDVPFYSVGGDNKLMARSGEVTEETIVPLKQPKHKIVPFKGDFAANRNASIDILQVSNNNHVSTRKVMRYNAATGLLLPVEKPKAKKESTSTIEDIPLYINPKPHRCLPEKMIKALRNRRGAGNPGPNRFGIGVNKEEENQRFDDEGLYAKIRSFYSSSKLTKSGKFKSKNSAEGSHVTLNMYRQLLFDLLNHQDDDGRTLLTVATAAGLFRLVEILLGTMEIHDIHDPKSINRRAQMLRPCSMLFTEDSINAMDIFGKTALHYAIERRHFKICDMLFTCPRFKNFKDPESIRWFAEKNWQKICKEIPRYLERESSPFDPKRGEQEGFQSQSQSQSPASRKGNAKMNGKAKDYSRTVSSSCGFNRKSSPISPTARGIAPPPPVKAVTEFNSSRNNWRQAEPMTTDESSTSLWDQAEFGRGQTRMKPNPKARLSIETTGLSSQSTSSEETRMLELENGMVDEEGTLDGSGSSTHSSEMRKPVKQTGPLRPLVSPIAKRGLSMFDEKSPSNPVSSSMGKLQNPIDGGANSSARKNQSKLQLEERKIQAFDRASMEDLALVEDMSSDEAAEFLLSLTPRGSKPTRPSDSSSERASSSRSRGRNAGISSTSTSKKKKNKKNVPTAPISPIARRGTGAEGFFKTGETEDDASSDEKEMARRELKRRKKKDKQRLKREREKLEKAAKVNANSAGVRSNEADVHDHTERINSDFFDAPPTVFDQYDEAFVIKNGELKRKTKDDKEKRDRIEAEKSGFGFIKPPIAVDKVHSPVEKVASSASTKSGQKQQRSSTTRNVAQLSGIKEKPSKEKQHDEITHITLWDGTVISTCKKSRKTVPKKKIYGYYDEGITAEDSLEYWQIYGKANDIEPKEMDFSTDKHVGLTEQLYQYLGERNGRHYYVAALNMGDDYIVASTLKPTDRDRFGNLHQPNRLSGHQKEGGKGKSRSPGKNQKGSSRSRDHSQELAVVKEEDATHYMIDTNIRNSSCRYVAKIGRGETGGKLLPVDDIRSLIRQELAHVNRMMGIYQRAFSPSYASYQQARGREVQQLPTLGNQTRLVTEDMLQRAGMLPPSTMQKQTSPDDDRQSSKTARRKVSKDHLESRSGLVPARPYSAEAIHFASNLEGTDTFDITVSPGKLKRPRSAGANDVRFEPQRYSNYTPSKSTQLYMYTDMEVKIGKTRVILPFEKDRRRNNSKSRTLSSPNESRSMNHNAVHHFGAYNLSTITSRDAIDHARVRRLEREALREDRIKWDVVRKTKMEMGKQASGTFQQYDSLAVRRPTKDTQSALMHNHVMQEVSTWHEPDHKSVGANTFAKANRWAAAATAVLKRKRAEKDMVDAGARPGLTEGNVRMVDAIHQMKFATGDANKASLEFRENINTIQERVRSNSPYFKRVKTGVAEAIGLRNTIKTDTGLGGAVLNKLSADIAPARTSAVDHLPSVRRVKSEKKPPKPRTAATFTVAIGGELMQRGPNLGK